ncbi:MAG: DNA-directed RNA polymerase subunit omega [Eubacterium sp.]|nr:DNA-directed RNA polymerase subunit omega [Eubacterium sp.]
MIHPSYSDLMEVVNEGVEPGEEPVVNSRYSIVMATAKRARQIIDGKDTLAEADCDKPFSVAVEELYEGKVNILASDDEVLEPWTKESLEGTDVEEEASEETAEEA